MSKILPRTKLPIKLRKPTRRDVLWGIAASPIATTFFNKPSIFNTNLESQIESYVSDWINPSINTRDADKTGWLVYSLDSNEFLANMRGNEFFQASKYD